MECQATHGGVCLLLFQVASSGVISTVAGSAQTTPAPATAATMTTPYAVALSSNGDVYISDSAHTVRKVNLVAVVV